MNTASKIRNDALRAVRPSQEERRLTLDPVLDAIMIMDSSSAAYSAIRFMNSSPALHHLLLREVLNLGLVPAHMRIDWM